MYPVCVGGRVAAAVVCLASSLPWCFDIPKACQTMGGSFVLPGDRYHRPVEDEKRFLQTASGFPHVNGHAIPLRPKRNADLRTSTPTGSDASAATVSLQHLSLVTESCHGKGRLSSTLIDEATGSSRKSATSPRRQVRTGPSTNPDINAALALGDRSTLTLFWLSGEPVGSVAYRIHPLNNKTRQSMRAMFKQVTLQTKESLNNIGTPPRGQSMKRANGSKPTFAKTITS